MVARLLALVAVVVVTAAPRAHAQPERAAVALLPLDAAEQLEIYGQPVASEIARALVAGGMDVVVVGPKMAVPDRATLIVDGTIAQGGDGEAVVLTVRVRNRADGGLVATLTSTAPTLTSIDKAAADVSAQVLPAVRARLAAMTTPTPPSPAPPSTTPPAPRPTLVAIAVPGPAQDGFRAALASSIAEWLSARTRTAVDTPPPRLAKRDAVATVKASGDDLGLAFEVLGYEVHGTTVPLARAKVRVRAASPAGIEFDRVVVTDTVVGDRGMSAAALASRVAREVLDILRPQFARKVRTWR